MTEVEWMGCTDPELMLEFLKDKASDRKLRLFACSGSGHARDSIGDERNQRAIEISSAWTAALGAARSRAGNAARGAIRSKTWRGEEWWDAAWSHALGQAMKTQATLLRDLFGPLPFRPTTLPSSVRMWNGGLIQRLAKAAYEHRLLPAGHLDPERLAVLADALEETGADAELVAHLRQPEAIHVRGCWAVDLALGRE